MFITGDQQLLKQNNRMVLVRKLCREPALSRADLAEAVGLTKSTVSLLVRELVDEGWLAENELLKTGSLGRRPTPLRIDTARLALIGAEMGIAEARIVAVDLVGVVLHRQTIPYENAADAADCLKLLARGLVRMERKAAAQGRGVLGVGIGLHGGVDGATGVLHYAPNLGWRNVDAAAQLRRHLAGSALDGLPLLLRNEADAAALAEFEFADQSCADPLIYLSMGHGVGAGVIVHDQLLTGYRGFSGEVGHSILQAGGPLCSCGRRGCADALIGLGALSRNAGQAEEGQSAAALAALFQRVQHGDAAACQAVMEGGRHLGVLLNNLWMAFDPMRIVLGGMAMHLGATLIEPALEVLGAYAAAAQLPIPVITEARYGDEAVAVGGAALVRYHLTRPFNARIAAA